MKVYQVKTSIVCDTYTDRHIAERELANLIRNGKQAILTEIENL